MSSKAYKHARSDYDQVESFSPPSNVEANCNSHALIWFEFRRSYYAVQKYALSLKVRMNLDGN